TGRRAGADAAPPRRRTRRHAAHGVCWEGTSTRDFPFPKGPRKPEGGPVRPCLPLRPAVGKSTTSAGEPGWGLDFLILSATCRPPGGLLWAQGFASPPHDGFAIIEDEEDETTMRRRGPAEEGECRSRRTTHDRPVPPRRECSRNKPPLEEVASGPSNRQGG